ncbi:amidohydrolase [Kosmotoga arenicorallina S304]|uniref:Amidohydrolase n=1 Tax=Kosmotoga arenicorallina S304 TaxID=1453497 RepID=A0A176JXJ1_9BACT|nr:amidohydrolase family protein [Kosmotoga arenicorallina]OAA28438.1 amidohydrolase [Kosmotoga arenicorallina S304]
MLIKNVSVFTGKDFIKHGYVVVRGNNFDYVGGTEPEGNYDEIIDGNGRLLMPGFINAHTHIYSAFARGMALDYFNPSSFTELLEQLWWRLDRKLSLPEIELSAYIAAVESSESGVTSLIDHHSSPAEISGSLNTIARAVNDVGLRVDTCYEVSDRDGVKAAERGISENVSFFERRNEFKGAHFGLHAGFTLSDETLKKVSEASKGRIPIHVHVAEGPEDEESSLSRYGKRVVQRFYDYELLIPGSIFAHCIHVNDNELALIKERDVYVVVNAQSNINNGVGITFWPHFTERGVKVGIGNDGFGFNIANDIRFFILTPHHEKRDPKVSSTRDLLNTFFKSNAEIASRSFGINLGFIEPEYRADFIIVDYNSPTPINSENFSDHFFYGIIDNLKVIDVYVSGKPVVKHGKNITIDKEVLYSEARKIASSLWRKI